MRPPRNRAYFQKVLDKEISRRDDRAAGIFVGPRASYFLAAQGLLVFFGAQDAGALGRVAVLVMAAMATVPRIIFTFAVGFDIGKSLQGRVFVHVLI